MNVVAGVEEAAGRDGDVVDRVAVERELEVQLDGGGAAITLGKHFVLLYNKIKYFKNKCSFYLIYLTTIRSY